MKRTWQRSSIGSRQMLAEISLTPFIGVLQAVLVICMFALPMATHKAETWGWYSMCGFGGNDRPQSIRVAIKQTGETYWNGIAVNRAELKSQLAFLAHTRGPLDRPQIEVVGEPATNYDDFIRVFATAKDAGLENVVASIE